MITLSEQDAGRGSDSSSVSAWIDRHSRGDDCSDKLWARYIETVTRTCRLRLTRRLQRTVSAEDLAQEVFCDFLIGIRGQRFPRLKNRQDAIRVLSMLITRNAIDHLRHHQSARQGAGDVETLSEVSRRQRLRDSSDRSDRFLAPVPGPVDEAEVRGRLVEMTPIFADPLLLELALDRIRGCTLREMANRHGIAVRSVNRKLQLIIESLAASQRMD